MHLILIDLTETPASASQESSLSRPQLLGTLLGVAATALVLAGAALVGVQVRRKCFHARPDEDEGGEGDGGQEERQPMQQMGGGTQR